MNCSVFGTLVLLCALFVAGNAQAVGPDANGVRYFFFSNYTSVFVIQAAVKPSVAFHPVLGGVDNTYIRYENWASFNFTDMHEYNANGVVGAKIDPMAMTWKITGTNDTDSKGNLHTKATITSDAPNGAHVDVYCESWSKGMTTPYGSLTNVISPDEVEISLAVSNWPFQSMNNNFSVTMLILLDGMLTGLPVINSPNSYQRSATISSATTKFSFTLMVYGLLDGTLTHFSYDKQLASFSGLYFILNSKAFNSTYLYDPNLSVLLQNNPDCSKISGCGHGTCVQDNVCQCKQYYKQPNCEVFEKPPDCSKLANCGTHGTCVDGDVCQCKQFYMQPDCVVFNETSTPTDQNPPTNQPTTKPPPSEDIGSHQKSHSVSTPIIIGVSVGAVALGVAALGTVFTIHHRRTRGQTRKLAKTLSQQPLNSQ